MLPTLEFRMPHMFDVFKWIFAMILHCVLITSPHLMAQGTPPAENESAQNSAANVFDDPNEPQLVAKVTSYAFFASRDFFGAFWPPSGKTIP